MILKHINSIAAFMHQQRHSLKPSLQHPDLSAIRVYSSARWFHKLFCVLTCFQLHLRHESTICYEYPREADRISFHRDFHSLCPNGQPCCWKRRRSCQPAYTFVRGITLTVYLLPPDVHWQRGDLHEPLQVPAYLHARQSGGVSQQELLWAQSTHVSPPSECSPTTHPTFFKVILFFLFFFLNRLLKDWDTWR